MLSRLVTRTNNIVFGYRSKESLELGFYRNQILHHFVKDGNNTQFMWVLLKAAHFTGLVACSLAALMKELPPNSGVTRMVLIEEVRNNPVYIRTGPNRGPIS